MLVIASIMSIAFAQNPNDPSTYPETIEVIMLTKEDVGKPVAGSNYTLVGVIGDVRYTLHGGPGVDLGTFKAKSAGGMYMDILTQEPSGRRYNTGFEIVRKERLLEGCKNESGN
jgi:hypothetical protein